MDITNVCMYAHSDYEYIRIYELFERNREHWYKYALLSNNLIKYGEVDFEKDLADRVSKSDRAELNSLFFLNNFLMQ